MSKIDRVGLLVGYELETELHGEIKLKRLNGAWAWFGENYEYIYEARGVLNAFLQWKKTRIFKVKEKYFHHLEVINKN